MVWDHSPQNTATWWPQSSPRLHWQMQLDWWWRFSSIVNKKYLWRLEPYRREPRRTVDDKDIAHGAEGITNDHKPKPLVNEQSQCDANDIEHTVYGHLNIKIKNTPNFSPLLSRM